MLARVEVYLGQLRVLIDDLDIYRSANLLVKQHGDEASIHTAMRADEVLDYIPRAKSKTLASPRTSRFPMTGAHGRSRLQC